MAKSKEIDIKKSVKYKLLTAAAVLFIFCCIMGLSSFAETPSPEATPDSTPISSATPENTSSAAPVTETPTAGITGTPIITATPTAAPETPAPVPPTPTQLPPETPSPTEIPTETVTITASPTPELHFLYDFTAPPLNPDSTSSVTIPPGQTEAPTMSAATVGIVQIESIDNTGHSFRWSDLIKYIAYAFYGLSGLAVLYGIACLVGLLCFKKDISIGAYRKKRKNNKGSQK